MNDEDDITWCHKLTQSFPAILRLQRCPQQIMLVVSLCVCVLLASLTHHLFVIHIILHIIIIIIHKYLILIRTKYQSFAFYQIYTADTYAYNICIHYNRQSYREMFLSKTGHCHIRLQNQSANRRTRTHTRTLTRSSCLYYVYVCILDHEVLIFEPLGYLLKNITSMQQCISRHMQLAVYIASYSTCRQACSRARAQAQRNPEKVFASCFSGFVYLLFTVIDSNQLWKHCVRSHGYRTQTVRVCVCCTVFIYETTACKIKRHFSVLGTLRSVSGPVI